MKKNGILLSLIALGLSGCATIFSGTMQTIHIKAVDANNNPLSDIRCVATDGHGGGYTIMTNPGSVQVSRKGAVVVKCVKEGYEQLNMAVGDSFNSVTLWNVFFWPGFIVDAASGSYRKFPSHYVVTMEKIKKVEKVVKIKKIKKIK